jgi:hypothetical protein
LPEAGGVVPDPEFDGTVVDPDPAPDVPLAPAAFGVVVDDGRDTR